MNNQLTGLSEEGKKILFNDACITFLFAVILHQTCVKRPAATTTMGYSFRLAARVLLYAPSHRYDNT